MSATIQYHKFTVNDYYRMAETGILREDDRVELLEGEIVAMSPIGIKHAACVDRINKIFMNKFQEHIHLRIQNPVRLGELSELEPDAAILKFNQTFYTDHHPKPDEVFLIVEVSDTSIGFDKTVKVPLYAKHGIPEVWIVDLGNDCIEKYWQPYEGEYQKHITVIKNDMIYVETFPEIDLNAADMIP